MADRSWVFGIDGWILEDGEYDDFECGQLRDFGIELSVHGFAVELAQTRAESARTATHLSAVNGARSVYDFMGEPIFVGEDAWLIDVGIVVCVSTFQLSAGGEVGDWLGGRGYFGLDSGFHHRGGRSPQHRYTWRIDRIERDMTPWLGTGPRTFTRDTASRSYSEVERTDAWEHQLTPEGNDYFLHCALVAASGTR